jgi:hypothetical protein
MYTIFMGVSGLPVSEWRFDTIERAYEFAAALWGWKNVTFIRLICADKVVREIYR